VFVGSDSNMKRSSSASGRKKLQPDQKTGEKHSHLGLGLNRNNLNGPSHLSGCDPVCPSALSSLDSAPAVSIQTELALEQLKQKHEQELQQLNIQLETQVTDGNTGQQLSVYLFITPPPPQVNYYERSLEKMRQSMEVERKDISQAFKVRRRV